MGQHGNRKVWGIDAEGVRELVAGEEADGTPELQAQQEDRYVQEGLPAPMAVVLRPPLRVGQVLLQIAQPACEQKIKSNNVGPCVVEAKSHSEWPTRGLTGGTPDPGREV